MFIIIYIHVHILQMGTPLQNNVKNVTTVAENFKYKLLLDQSDMYSTWIVLEYIRYMRIINDSSQ